MKKKVQAALLEDASADVTTQALVLKGTARAVIVAKENGVLCGVLEAKAAFKGLKAHWKVKEGQAFGKGQVLVEIEGEVRKILAAERTALNYLMVLSGIATTTRKWVKRFGKRVACLRKTHPLLSPSEKRAVFVGGGLTHRWSLADGYLVKENHVFALSKQEKIPYLQALKLAVRKAKKHTAIRPSNRLFFVEVEVRSFEEAVAAASEGPDALLVDNCAPREVKRIVAMVRKSHPRILVEASGGITEGNAGAYLKAGADFVSTSALTLRAKPIDLTLLLK